MNSRGSLLLAAAYALFIASMDCAASPPGPATRTFAFTADAPMPGDEAYVCFGFDASAFVATTLQSIRWQPAKGPASLHHATLYALTTDVPDGPWSCDDMPNAVGLSIWAPGSSDLVLPDDIGLQIPTV